MFGRFVFEIDVTVNHLTADYEKQKKLGIQQFSGIRRGVALYENITPMPYLAAWESIKSILDKPKGSCVMYCGSTFSHYEFKPEGVEFDSEGSLDRALSNLLIDNYLSNPNPFQGLEFTLHANTGRMTCTDTLDENVIKEMEQALTNRMGLTYRAHIIKPKHG